MTDFGTVESLIQGGWLLFGDGDHATGFNFAASGYGLSGPSNLDMFAEDGTSGRGSSHCSSDGTLASVVRCVAVEDLGSFVTTNSGAGQDAGSPFGQQSSGPDAPIGGTHLSPQQLLEMLAAQYSFAMSWQWGAIQGTFPPGDATPPVVGPSTSDFVNLNWSPNLVSPPVTTSVVVGTSQRAAVVPEIPQWTMLLIGFGGLALVGRRRLRRSARLGQEPGST